MNRLMDTKKSSMGDNDNNDSNVNGLSLEERFQRLESLLSIGPTLFDGKSINSELLADVLQNVSSIHVFYEKLYHTYGTNT